MGKAHLQTQINPAKSRVLLFDEPTSGIKDFDDE
jgi:hypothetical protein